MPAASVSGILSKCEDCYVTSLLNVPASEWNLFVEDRHNGKQQSLRTRDPVAAQRIFNAKNEAYGQPAINLQIAKAYLTAADP
jgi:hypothetical protein